MSQNKLFEVHITGSYNIHKAAFNIDERIKTIEVQLLNLNYGVIGVEHMTSFSLKCYDYLECFNQVMLLKERLEERDVDIYRVKIESPFWEGYVRHSLYIESHFPSKNEDDFIFPKSHISKVKVYKTSIFKEPEIKLWGHKISSTSREYNKEKYDIFRQKHKEVELCLYDSNVNKDKHWFDLY